MPQFEHNDSDLFSHLQNDDIERPPASDAIADTRPVPQVGEAKISANARIIQAQTKQGLSVFLGSAETGISGPMVLDSVSKQHNTFWLVNAKAAGVRDEERLDPDADLFTDFARILGKELATGNSLHLFSHGNPEIADILNSAISNDAAICVGTPLDQQELATKLKPVLAWFTRTSSLKLQLDHGEGFLIDQIFENLTFIFVFDLEAGHWVLFNGSTPALSWESLGLPICPTVD